MSRRHLFLAILVLLSFNNAGFAEKFIKSEPIDLTELSYNVESNYPGDVQKYIELSDNCKAWANNDAHAESEAIEAVNQHANFTSTRCYTLQVKYNQLMDKYEGQSAIETAIEAHHLNY